MNSRDLHEKQFRIFILIKFYLGKYYLYKKIMSNIVCSFKSSSMKYSYFDSIVMFWVKQDGVRFYSNILSREFFEDVKNSIFHVKSQKFNQRLQPKFPSNFSNNSKRLETAMCRKNCALGQFFEGHVTNISKDYQT